MITKRERRRALALVSLAGLSVGDAFGERFFTSESDIEGMIGARVLPAAPWSFTDDTVMAMSIVDVLSEAGEIDRDVLAGLFGARYRLDPGRGYGGTAHRILAGIAAGGSWAEAARAAFHGAGSMGNGAAMRAAPIGAYFHDDYRRAAEEARKSAEVTHAHAEGQAGAIAVAVAAACVARGGGSAAELFDAVLQHTPGGKTRDVVEQASGLPLGYDIRTAVAALGNGSALISQDTVPFCIWCAARHLDDFEAAMWSTVSGLGDRDTTCAIVGGIVSLSATTEVPPDWIAAREPLARMSRGVLDPRFHARP